MTPLRRPSLLSLQRHGVARDGVAPGLTDCPVFKQSRLLTCGVCGLLWAAGDGVACCWCVLPAPACDGEHWGLHCLSRLCSALDVLLSLGHTTHVGWLEADYDMLCCKVSQARLQYQVGPRWCAGLGTGFAGVLLTWALGLSGPTLTSRYNTQYNTVACFICSGSAFWLQGRK